MRRGFPKWTVVLVLVLAASHGPAWADASQLADPVSGPRRICLNYVAFDLAAGERITHFGAGTETAFLKIERADGSTVSIGESQIYQQPRRRGTLVRQANRMRIYRTGGSAPVYMIYGPADFTVGQEHYLANVSSEATTGGGIDAELIKSFGMIDDKRSGCQQGFVYGWDYMLPAEEENAQ
ncbi:hypothetical protein V6U71_19230 [Sphingopyxis sp. J-6]|uniref:hypothetical protein n=1 Tax=Sphingopyxis sp. J-6 TaxID=3122054 RepID=UPI003984419A